MKINLDRLSKLAGLPVQKTSSSRTLKEGKQDMKDMESKDESFGFDDFTGDMGDMGDMEYMEEMSDIAWKNEKKSHEDDEVIEVDEAMLVQELRRMKGIIQESKRRKALMESQKRQSKESLYEAQLKRVIDEEVRNVMQEMNLTGNWMYGDKKPTRSRNGYSHQGSYLKGFGFK